MSIATHISAWNPSGGALAGFVRPGRRPGPAFGRLERIAALEGFAGGEGQICQTVTGESEAVERLVLAGLGNATAPAALQAIGAKLAQEPWLVRSGRVTLDLAGLSETEAEHLLVGLLLRYYRFDTYRTDRTPLPELLVDLAHCPAGLAARIGEITAEVEAVHLVRDLVNLPGNVLNPAEFARRIAETLVPLGLTVEVLDTERLGQMGANLLLGVGQGSANPPAMVVIRMEGPGPLQALVGKGLTFDTGGIHIKPVAGMWEMKNDMAGAATIVGALHALARTGRQRNLVAVLGLAENMTSGSAIRPGDILKSLSGQMVEVRNTDCEGRLVLADCLTHAQRAFAPERIIDVATLTYAVQIGLGPRYAGIYGNDEALTGALLAAAKANGELAWPMPIDAGFHEELASDFADFLNWPGVPYGNASIAAAFLEKFIENRPWGHIDIAGPAYAPRGSTVSPAGGTGYGVRLLTTYLTDTQTASETK